MGRARARAAAVDASIYARIGATETPRLDAAMIGLSRAADHGKLWFGAAAAKIESQIVSAKDGGPEVVHSTTLENAIRSAHGAAKPGDTVLLAPACASFDQFKSYEHRGRVFKEIVKTLEAEPKAS